MSRLIDENDIIKMLNTMDRYTSEELTLCDTDKTFPMNEVFIVDDVFEGLDELPSAQPERQKGEWIDYTEDGYVECPFCHSATNCDGNKDELHFCFSCGADMREDGAEQDG